jgi:CHAD domain-containing protein
MKELAGALTLRRDAAFGKASAAVESRRYRSLLFDTLQWLETGDWAKHARYYKQRPIERFAADIFARRTKTITKKAKKIRELDSQQRHKLRIAVKKLHRAAPAFGPQPDRRAVTSPVFRRRIKAL